MTAATASAPNPDTPTADVAPCRDLFAEAADMSNAELERRLRTLAGQINAATGVFLVYLGAFDLADGWHGVGVASCAHWLSYSCGMSLSAAGEQVRVARRLRELPVMRQAMLAGRLSFSKVRALTRVATTSTEADLVEMALGCSASQLDKICRALARALTDEQAQERAARVRFSAAYDSDGMLVGTFRLTPEEGAVLMAAIDAHLPDRVRTSGTDGTATRPGPKVRRDSVGEQPAAPTETAAPDALSVPDHRLDRSRAAALIEVARQALAHPAPDGPAPTVTEVVIHLNGNQLDRALADRATLTGSRTSTAESTVPVSEEALGWVEDGPGLALATLERLLCDASVRTRCGHEHPDAPDPRAHREPSRAQRRALWRRDRGCRAPGCTRRRGLHAHHIRPWWQGGPTTLGNLLLLCPQHHHLVHEGGWTLSVRDHHVVLVSPDATTTLVEAPPTHGSLDQFTRQLPARIDQHTLTGQQTGDPLDLDYAVNVIATNIQLAEEQAATT